MAAAIATRFLRPAVFKNGPCFARSSRHCAHSLTLGLRTIASSVQDGYVSKTKVSNGAWGIFIELLETEEGMDKTARKWLDQALYGLYDC